MKNYAMVLLGRVIGVLESLEEPWWPPDPDGNPVNAIECDETVEMGMYYRDGSFTDEAPPEPPAPVEMPTNIELMLMANMAAIYEELQENRLSQMKANADIYEAILSNGGNV